METNKEFELTTRQEMLLGILEENIGVYLSSKEIFDLMKDNIVDSDKYQCNREVAYKLINEDVEAINSNGKRIVISSRANGYKIAESSEEFQKWFDLRTKSLKLSIKSVYRLAKHAREDGQMVINFDNDDIEMIRIFGPNAGRILA